ncbi:MAG: (2Fe-2S)-binding protein, partial [Campylobacterales bacterium]|nr:(2Fe-2S)-binding protein [Campylobacterales bacterium]
MIDKNRRLVNYSLLALTGVGGYFTVETMFQSLEPPKKALLEAATLIDTATLSPNTVSFFSWLKKPIFIYKHDASVPFDPKRDV